MITVLTFGSESVFVVVMSLVAYTSLALVVVLHLRVRALHRTVSSLRAALDQPHSCTGPASSTANRSATVKQWASRRSPARTLEPGALAGPPRPSRPAPAGTADDRTDPAARMPVPRPSAQPVVARQGASRERSPVTPTETDLVPASPTRDVAVNVQGRTVTGGRFSAGNGKDQDRALVVLNTVLHPPGQQSWVSYVVLCDGAGGVGDGAAAADTALSSFRDSLERWLHDEDNARALKSRDLGVVSASLQQCAKEAHKATRLLSRNPLTRGSATTIDAALLLPGRDPGLDAIVIHVGDGVVWTLDERGLHRQSPGPTATPTEPHAIGADLDPRAEIWRLALPPGTRLVLTSDGFEAGLPHSARDATTSVAAASAVAASLVRTGASSAEIAHRLGHLAAERSPDDVTVVVTG